MLHWWGGLCYLGIHHSFTLLTDSSGLYDMTMLRFEHDQRVGFRECLRSDGTSSYFFCIYTVGNLLVGAGFIELSSSLRLNSVESSHLIDEMGCEGCGFMESTRSCYEFRCQAEGSWLLKIAYLVALAPSVHILLVC
ncbi:hypothetical protein SLEP1_g23617 [Rubroshorea leprosula]|uniref:Uncharacterized protein n=1 Tax=Rubroshorea leprosula TaxID=152421 RepID=A0AAV5JNX5_9ROSI|nr:hypothetical protein SLEP1_g23617 [Rubroshorea leprosula]